MRSARWKSLSISAFGQGGSALLTLLYLRAAVRGFSPEAYGVAAAWLGTHTLLRGALLLPLLQLFLFQYQGQELKGNGHAFSRSIFRSLLVMCLLATVLALLGLHAFPPTASRWVSGGLAVGALGLTEALKSLGLNQLNHQEHHRRYALAMVGDAAFRYLLLQIYFLQGGRDGLFLVLLPAMSSGVVAFLLRVPQRPVQNVGNHSTLELLKNHWTFLSPLVFFAFSGWTTGMADRYLLLKWAGEGHTGIYSAIYGFFGTPFPLLISTLVLVYRPQLCSQYADGHTRAEYERTYRQYMLIGLVALLLLAGTLWLLGAPLTRIFLRPAHQSALHILPWILVGQFCFAGGQLFELEFFIQAKLKLVVIKQSFGMAAALIAMVLLIPTEGIQGAAKACTWYYGTEFSLGGLLFFWNRSRSKG